MKNMIFKALSINVKLFFKLTNTQYQPDSFTCNTLNRFKFCCIGQTSCNILQSFLVKVGQVNKACQKNKLKFVTPFYLFKQLLVCKNYLKSLNLCILQTGSLLKKCI